MSTKMSEKKILVQDGIRLDYLDIDKEDMSRLDRFNPENIQSIDENDKKNTIAMVFRADMKINQALLDDFVSLEYLGLVSTGKDNINLPDENRFQFVHASGFNSTSVAEYTYEALLLLFNQYPKMIEKKIQIIGYGNIGSRLAAMLSNARLDYSAYDPFVIEESKIDENADIVTFHVPLTTDGKHPTYGMINENADFFRKKNPWIIQTSRGKIWDRSFYESYATEAKIWTQDVYYKEPPPEDYKENAFISTPHIAGYSFEGKTSGTKYVLETILKKKLQYKKTFRGRFRMIDHISDCFKSSKEFIYLRNNFVPRKEYKNFSESERIEYERHFHRQPKEMVSFLWEN